MKILKFLNWVFNVSSQYKIEKDKYQRKGIVAKILSLLLLGACVAGVFGLGFLTVKIALLISFDSAGSIFLTNLLCILGIIVCGALTISCGFKVIGLVIQNAIFAFATVSQKRKQIRYQKKMQKELAQTSQQDGVTSEDQTNNEQVVAEQNSQTENLEQPQNTTLLQNVPQQGVPTSTCHVGPELVENKHHWAFDVVYGVLCLGYIAAFVLAIALVVTK